MRYLAGLFIFVIIIYWASSAFNQKWIGFYYPNEDDLLTSLQSQELDSIEQCREWVNQMISQYNPDGYGYDYECGKNCKLSDTGVGLYHCEETIE